jgi:hypothetical protein
MAEREEMQNHQNPKFGFFNEYEHFLEISRNLEEIFSSKNIEETNPLEKKIDEGKIQEKSNFSYMRGLYTYLCLVFTDNIIRWIIMVFFPPIQIPPPGGGIVVPPVVPPNHDVPPGS